MFVELHLLQNIPPANLNRDDTGMPKDCEFGGVRRSRVSSQSWKRAMRFHSALREMEDLSPAERTKLLFARIGEKLVERGHDKKLAESMAKLVLKEAGFGIKESKKKKDDEADDDPEGATSILYFVSHDAIDAIADIIHENADALSDGKKADPELLTRVAEAVAEKTDSPDLALFGRMIAVEPKGALGKQNLRIDASCQVAHAISTNRVSMEEDFFTAVDDLQPENETGAGMMGVVDFNSSCFYRYMVIDTRQLTKNLHGNADLARRTVEGFLRAAVEAIPTGKQNTFAAHTPPDLVHAVVRDGLPISLANAFVQPVAPDNKHDLMHKSIDALNTHANRITSVYGDRGSKFNGYISLREEDATALGQRTKNLDALIDAIVSAAFNPEA